jgi:hypothetical protein
MSSYYVGSPQPWYGSSTYCDGNSCSTIYR